MHLLRRSARHSSLNAMAGVQAVRLDVTIPEQIEAAVGTVRAGGRGLHGLINNAGVAALGPVAEIRDQDLAFDLDVNVWGPVRVTRAFAPMIAESRGRMATTTSIEPGAYDSRLGVGMGSRLREAALAAVEGGNR